jgi:hypothetical protein
MNDQQKAQVAVGTILDMKAAVEQRCVNLAIENAELREHIAALEAKLAAAKTPKKTPKKADAPVLESVKAA